MKQKIHSGSDLVLGLGGVPHTMPGYPMAGALALASLALAGLPLLRLVAWAFERFDVSRDVPELGYAMAQGEAAITLDEELYATRERAWPRNATTLSAKA